MKAVTVAAFCLWASAALAAPPTISTVSGPPVHGQTLTVTGANFVQENTAGWDDQFAAHPTMYGFEGTAPTSTGSDGWFMNAGMDCLYDPNIKLTGSKSLRCHVAGGGVQASPNDGGAAIWYLVNDENPHFYFRFYTRWHAVNNVWPDNYTKLIFTGMNTGPNIAQWYWELHGGAHTWYWKWSGYDTGDVPVEGGQIQNDRWYLVEGAWSNSPKSMKVWVDNVLVLDETPTTEFSNSATNIGIINYSSINVPIELTNHIDNFAFSPSGRIYPSSLIELSTSATYGQGATRYQPPTALGDGSVQVTVDLAGLGQGPYCLWVTNNRRERSQPRCWGALPDGGVPAADAAVPDARPSADASVPPGDAGAPGAVTDLAVTATAGSSATLLFTEVADGAGQPARYMVRVAPAPIDWGTATEVSQGSCATPVVGGAVGAARSCTVGGLQPATAYEFQLVPFRGTLHLDAVFGPLSNVAAGTTSDGTPSDAGSSDASATDADAGVSKREAGITTREAGVINREAGATARDAGTRQMTGEGCSCGVGSGADLSCWALIALAVLVGRRRRQRAR